MAISILSPGAQIETTNINAGNLGSGVLPYITTSTTATAFKIPFINSALSTSGNYGLLQDSTATFTYNPSTDTVTAGTFAGALTGNASTASAVDMANLTGTVYAAGSGAALTSLTAANISAGTITATLSGNASTATNVPASGLTGTTLAAGVVTSSLTTVGTITAGTWQGTAINQTYLVGQSGTNTGDQTSIVGITGTLAQFNTAITDATLATGGGTATGTNTGDQTTVTGNAGTVTVGSTAGTLVYPLLGTAATGSLSPATDVGITYNASTNALSTTTFIGALTGNASTATNVAASGLTGTTLASGVVTSSLTTVGIIGAGTWQGTAINQTYLVGQSGTNTGDEPAASLTVPGIVELATVLETNTGTDATRAVTPAGLTGWTGDTGIVTVGTITSGTWQGTTVAVNQGGTGVTTSTGTGSTVLSAAPTFTGTIGGASLTLSGDLTVNGTTTTINTTNTVVTDSLIELSNGTAGAPVNDGGFVIERGTSDNVFVGWDEATDEFTIGTGTFTGASTGALITVDANVRFANIKGTLTTASQTNITGVGTIGTGTWQGTAINQTYLVGQSGTNTGDQTSIVGITGTLAQFNTAITDATLATGGGTATGSNTGDQTTVTGNAGTVTVGSTAGTLVYPLLGTAATGSLSPATDVGITYNASTNALTTTTFVGALTGNASTATNVAASGLTGTTLAAGVVTSSLTTVGTITAGTWSGSFGAVSGANLTTLTAANINAGNLGSGVNPYFTASAGAAAYKIPFLNNTGNASVNTNMLLDSGVGEFTYNPSTNTLTATNITGLASSAKYADLAERYKADDSYGVGTVMVFGGSDEVTHSTTQNDHRVAGVISVAPAYLMNVDAGNNATHPAIGLTGRVPCKVKGNIQKGDLMITSDTPGVATSLGETPFKPGAIFGKALEAYNSTDVGTIEVVLGY